jgi:hypothetical protein
MDAPTFAHRIRISPIRRVYAYFDHLVSLDLVVRRVDLGSRLQFQIAGRGLKRLNWLRGQQQASFLEELFMPLLRTAAITQKN